MSSFFEVTVAKRCCTYTIYRAALGLSMGLGGAFTLPLLPAQAVPQPKSSPESAVDKMPADTAINGAIAADLSTLPMPLPMPLPVTADEVADGTADEVADGTAEATVTMDLEMDLDLSVEFSDNRIQASDPLADMMLLPAPEAVSSREVSHNFIPGLSKHLFCPVHPCLPAEQKAPRLLTTSQGPVSLQPGSRTFPAAATPGWVSEPELDLDAVTASRPARLATASGAEQILSDSVGNRLPDPLADAPTSRAIAGTENLQVAATDSVRYTARYTKESEEEQEPPSRPDLPDWLLESVASPEASPSSPVVLPEPNESPNVATEEEETAEDGELGSLRVRQVRSRNEEELGILRLMQTAQAPPPPPKQPVAYLFGRTGFFHTNNAFRSNSRQSEDIYQSGLTFYLSPQLSDKTSLYASAETNLARYGDITSANYNELEFQIGLRQRLRPRTYAQIGWRNQQLYTPGFREKLFTINYLDALISHRSILSSRLWLDSFYQMRLGFADIEQASRFRQTLTLSLNYGINRDFRTSLLYQLDFDDYTQQHRFDVYQQILGVVSYNITPESRITFFGGTRFGDSSSPGVNLADTFYGTGLNVNVPLF